MNSIPDEGKKVCLKCELGKNREEFGRDARRPDGLFPYCKRCRLKRPEIYDEKLQHKGERRCSSCKTWMSLDRFGSNRSNQSGLHTQCRNCASKQTKKYLAGNPEKAKRKWASRYWGNKSGASERWQRYYGQNREKLIRRAFVRRQTQEGKASIARGNAIRRNRVASVPVTLTAEEWQEIIVAQNNSCNGCGRLFTETLKPTRDHIIPLLAYGGLTKGNVQALCRSCNSKKGSRLP
jgi:5-methylcytosine-specific restriction endonuclease McrA